MIALIIFLKKRETIELGCLQRSIPESEEKTLQELRVIYEELGGIKAYVRRAVKKWELS